jgi:hypothetical protein
MTSFWVCLLSSLAHQYTSKGTSLVGVQYWEIVGHSFEGSVCIHDLIVTFGECSSTQYLVWLLNGLFW